MNPILRFDFSSPNASICSLRSSSIAWLLLCVAFTALAQDAEHALRTIASPPLRASRSGPSIPVIIDTDIGDDIDDAFALALAVRSPEMHILGVTTAFGDTALRAHLTARLLNAFDHPEIPIYTGVSSTRHFDNFSQIEYARADTHTLVMRDAVDFLLKTARRYPHRVTLIALGPMDNIGAAIDRDPAAFRLFKRVVLMGGSVRKGYDGGPPSAEWNILNNIPAARKLFASGVAMLMLPLDSTQIRLGVSGERILNRQDKLSADLTELTRESKRPDPVLFDPVTIAAIVDARICPTQPMHLEVDDKGVTFQTSEKPNVNVCLASNQEAFLKLLTERLAPK